MSIAHFRWLGVAVLSLAFIAALAALLGTSMAGRSSDLAWHYILVDYFTRSWHLPPQVVPDMASYAPISHMIGGAIGRLVGSGFMGMHIASLAFIFLIYLLVFLGLERKTLFTTLVSFALLFLAIAALHSSFALYGYETIGNFFYAHVAGEAAFLACLYILSGRERSEAELWQVPLLVILLGWVFPLGQVKLAAGALILWAVTLLQTYRDTGRIARRTVLAFAALAGLLFLSIYFHPEFAYFRVVAEHNGATNQKIGLAIIAMLAGGLLLASLAVLWLAVTRRLGLERPLFIGSAGLASLIAWFGQASLYFGFGLASEYAVRKHAYAITTLLAACVIIIAIEGLTRAWPTLPRLRLPPALGGAMAAAGSFLVVYALVSHYAEDRTAFLAYQHEVQTHPRLRGRTMSLNRDHPPEFNLAVSVVDLGLPPAVGIKEVLGRPRPDVSDDQRPPLEILSPRADIPANCLSHEIELRLGRLVQTGCH